MKHFFRICRRDDLALQMTAQVPWVTIQIHIGSDSRVAIDGERLGFAIEYYVMDEMYSKGTFCCFLLDPELTDVGLWVRSSFWVHVESDSRSMAIE